MRFEKSSGVLRLGEHGLEKTVVGVRGGVGVFLRCVHCLRDLQIFLAAQEAFERDRSTGFGITTLAADMACNTDLSPWFQSGKRPVCY